MFSQPQAGEVSCTFRFAFWSRPWRWLPLALSWHSAQWRADIIISSGYYDLSPAASGGGPPLPDPWFGSANTTFFGSTSDLANAVASDPDISAVLIQNTGATSASLSALSLSPFGMDILVRASTPNGNLPVGNVTLAAGQSYIFAVGDGSEVGLRGQTISVALNSRVFNFADATTTLAPSGVLAGDIPQLGAADETQPWAQDADLSGSAVPEPSMFTLFGLGIAGLLSLGWHRRKLTVA